MMNPDIIVLNSDRNRASGSSAISSRANSSLFSFTPVLSTVRNEEGDDDNNAVAVQDDGANGDVEEAAPYDFGWAPSGIKWRDILFFCGPGWLVSIAYVDPGNYQADINAGATTQYTLLWAQWWSSIYSIYVQVMCVRLGYRTKMALSEVQAYEYKRTNSQWKVYIAWFIAEFSVMITDLPEVIGFGIALNLFFGLATWIGVLLSLVTTMLFLATQRFGIQTMEFIICFFVGIMSVALFVEMGSVGADGKALMEGWVYGFIHIDASQLFVIVGIIGAVCMPHNLYLHSGTCQERKVDRRNPESLDLCVKYCSWEPVLPIIISFFVNMAVQSIAAETVFGTPNAANVGLTDFCNYFKTLKGGCYLWGIALLAAGQSSAITTTYSGQFVMDGFLNLRLNIKLRAIATRLVAILPCVLVAALLPNDLNFLVNIVNASLSILLPFALLPLIKYNCSEQILGEYASKGCERYLQFGIGIAVYLINVATLSIPGGGCFGDVVDKFPKGSTERIGFIILEVLLQIVYFLWCAMSLFQPIKVEGESLADIAMRTSIEEINKHLGEETTGKKIEDSFAAEKEVPESAEAVPVGVDEEHEC